MVAATNKPQICLYDYKKDDESRKCSLWSEDSDGRRGVGPSRVHGYQENHSALHPVGYEYSGKQSKAV